MGYEVTGNLKKKVIEHLNGDTYAFTKHALDSMADDELSRLDVVKVLKSSAPSHAENEHTAALGWTYAFRGQLDDQKIKVVVSFERDESNEEMLIINAYTT